MAKVKKHTLKFDDTIAYELIGICSHHRDYRLVWSINERLNWDFIKAEKDFDLYKKGEVCASFNVYEYKNLEEFEEFYLLKNKQNGEILIPEKPMIDYFLFAYQNAQFDMDELVNQLKKLNSVLAVYQFDANSLKSTENIIFE